MAEKLIAEKWCVQGLIPAFLRHFSAINLSATMFDNSQAGSMNLIAAGTQGGKVRVAQKTLWKQIEQEYRK